MTTRWQESPESDHMDYTLHREGRSALVCMRPDRDRPVVVVDGSQRWPWDDAFEPTLDGAKRWVEKYFEVEAKLAEYRETLWAECE